MGTATVQGDLWGAKAEDWTELCEPMGRPAVKAVFDRAKVGAGMRLLDLGCGAGGALLEAKRRGADVAGLDASEALVAVARRRLPGVRIEIGELEELPFEDASADLVTGFNSFQFAGDMNRVLAEARRVTKPGGSVGVVIWAAREECETMLHTFTPVMALMGPPPAPPPPPLATPGLMASKLRDAGLEPYADGVAEIPFEWPDVATTWRACSAAGMMVGVIRAVGEDTVRRTLMPTLAPFTRADGSVLQRNRFLWFLARRP